MAIVMTLDKYSFADAFKRYNRQDQFSPKGLEVLFDYLEEFSDSTGEPVELDVIALCCEYYELSIQELINNYNIDVSDADGDEDTIAKIVKDYILSNTAYVGETEGCLIYAAF